jgi:hypothetical protein
MCKWVDGRAVILPGSKEKNNPAKKVQEIRVGKETKIRK